MKLPAALVSLATSFALACTQASVSTPASTSATAKWTAQLAAERVKSTPAVLATKDAQMARHLFPVNDEKGLLLTCVAPEIETNANTDIFNHCTLAPGRTLDDVMHSFIQGIHEEQNQRMKEHMSSANEGGATDQKTALK